ncbi:hypothetical protein evm_007085 [Chilo suppressalis]|nr:hypothetical protein evm_007085 [Chilo suppressalis]
MHLPLCYRGPDSHVEFFLAFLMLQGSAISSHYTLAPSHLHGTNNRAGAACEAAEKAKASKYRVLGSEYDFVPFGVETLGPWGHSALRLFEEIAKRLVDITRDRRAGSYLGQRISLAIQRAGFWIIYCRIHSKQDSIMAPNLSLLLLFVALSSVSAQTFQYSRGWTNGKRDGMKRDAAAAREMAALERIMSPCQMNKLKNLLEGRPLNDRLFGPCDYFEEEEIQPKRSKTDHSADSLYEAFQ